MKIGILEDEWVWRDRIEAIIQKYCADKNISLQIHSYSSGKDLMKNADVDLLFLDIELTADENGFELAEQLMSSGNHCKICFLTSHTEYARLGYRVNAFRYIDKKHLEEINEALDVFVKTKIQERSIFCDNTGGIRIQIYLNEILLIETYGRKLHYRMLDGSEHFCKGLISETARSLSQFGFFQIHRSYIVNLKHIEMVNSHEVTLCSGLKVVIGRVYIQEFKKEFFKWRMWFDI